MDDDVSHPISDLKTSKYLRRILTIATNSIHSLTLPIFNVAVSFLVVRLASVDLWGEFVNALIIVQLGTHVVNWGNKQYLLRAFSQSPAQITDQWQTSLVTRLTLLVGFCAVLAVLDFSPWQTLLLSIWAVGLVLFQSHDVLVLYRRDFIFATVVEVASLGLMAGVIIHLGSHIGLNDLIALFCGVNLGKAAILLLRYRHITLSEVAGRIDFGYFGVAFPFFLLGFSGMLQSRIDLYCVNYFLPQQEVGRYQVFINLMLYLQAISAFILMPFVKSIYRMTNAVIVKISVRLFAFGLLMIVPLLAVADVVLRNLYGFDFSFYIFLAGGLLVVPTFFYLPIIYALYGDSRESVVIKINVLGIAANFGLNVFLLPRIGIAGAVTASAAAQWVMLVAYMLQSRRIQSEEVALAVPELS